MTNNMHGMQRWMRRWAWLWMLASIVGSGAFIQPQLAHAVEPGCFEATTLCIAEEFRSYWEQNGGLEVFGYPLTPATPETNRDTGMTYTTQWFERYRLELHPENAEPYTILLGRIGDQRLVQLGRSWRAEAAAPTAQPGCLWFAETQQTTP